MGSNAKTGSAAKIRMESFDDLFGGSDAQESGTEQIINAPLAELHTYAVLCYLGGKEDRKKLADAQQAEQHMMLYCRHGFRIWP